jgi:hypothetical protein
MHKSKEKNNNNNKRNKFMPKLSGWAWSDGVGWSAYSYREIS